MGGAPSAGGMPAPGKRLRGPNGNVVLTKVDVGVGDVTAGTEGEGLGVDRATGAMGVDVRVAVAGTVVEVREAVGVTDAPGVTVVVVVDDAVGVEVEVGTAVAVWLDAGVLVKAGAVCVGVSVFVAVATPVGVWLGAGVAVTVAAGPVGVAVGLPATVVGVFVDVGTPVGVRLGAAVGVAVAAGPVGVAVALPGAVVGVLVAVGTPVGVCVATGCVTVDVGTAAPQGGKLGDFSGLRSGRTCVSVSIRSALARGSTAATEIGPKETITVSPGATVTSSRKLPPGTGTNSAVPPRDGGMCCINRNGMLSLIVEDVEFEMVTVPETPPGPHVASISTIVRPPDATRAEPEADALATIAAPSASAMIPATKWPLRAGMPVYVSNGEDDGGVMNA